MGCGSGHGPHVMSTSLCDEFYQLKSLSTMVTAHASNHILHAFNRAALAPWYTIK